MKVIGLCGGSGSGKGTVCEIFRDYGIPSIDTDSVYHRITSYMSPCLCELVSHFGKDIVKDGRLDRAALRNAVFGNADSTERHRLLNRITHKHVLDEVRVLLAEYEARGYGAVIVDAPMLFESGFQDECTEIICVTAEENIRIARIMLRDGISYEDARRRIASQKSDSWLIDNTDYHIDNSGDIDTLRCRVSELAGRISD